MLVPLVSERRVSRMFAGFTSRWTSPALCAVSKASATGARMSSACLASNGPLVYSNPARLLPRTYRIAM